MSSIFSVTCTDSCDIGALYRLSSAASASAGAAAAAAAAGAAPSPFTNVDNASAAAADDDGGGVARDLPKLGLICWRGQF